jgi:uncharacterized protein (TIGR02996 family)
MSDEEPFMRAIVDNPGDETPRMVYADWLEERGDRRARYLRAEQEAASTGDTTEMQELAVGLDPVWVARVTLPPFGVCFEHAEIRDRGQVIDPQDIEKFEQDFGITLPPDYRAFLLNYNGGLIDYCPYETPDGAVIRYGSSHEFYSLQCGSPGTERDSLELYASSRGRYITECFLPDPPDPDVERWFLQFITIGRSPDWQFGMLLGITQPEFGQVWYLDYNGGLYPGLLNQERKPAAASFSQFLSYLL